jgi:hypothetical protein
VWNSPATDMRLKQRIVRILIEEIIADVDDVASEIVLLIHWTGGRHSELRMKKNLTGRHSCCTNLETIEVLRRMSGRFPDDQIAATLNRLGLKTGTFVRIRQFGHLTNTHRSARLALARQLLAVAPEPPKPSAPDIADTSTYRCPHCNGEMRIGPNLSARQLASQCRSLDSS